jgi:ABC-type transporter Mla MlaB component
VRAVDLVIDGLITPSDVRGLCARARLLLEGSDADVLVCDVGAFVLPDAVAVEALARLQLTARRLGRQVRLRHASVELKQLLDLVGLADVVPPERLTTPG